MPKECGITTSSAIVAATSRTSTGTAFQRPRRAPSASAFCGNAKSFFEGYAPTALGCAPLGKGKVERDTVHAKLLRCRSARRATNRIKRKSRRLASHQGFEIIRRKTYGKFKSYGKYACLVLGDRFPRKSATNYPHSIQVPRRARRPPIFNQFRVVAEPGGSPRAAPAFGKIGSHGQGLQLRGGIQKPRFECGREGPACLDDRLARVVAGGFWPLRTAVHSHGLAQRRHVPHWRRARRRRIGAAALCPAQQLAGQRQP